MALHIHRAEDADVLAAALAEVLAEPLPDPLTAEIVMVGGFGIQRWLTQRLADRLGTPDADSSEGVAANIRFPSPTALVGEVLTQASQVGAGEDPWAAQHLVWHVLRAFAEVSEDPQCAVLARYLRTSEGAGAGGRSYATAVRMATLFDRYAANRPRMIREWAAGADTDGLGAPLPEDMRWQPVLWRAVRAAVGTPSPPEHLARLLEQTPEKIAKTALPQRISIFGAVAIPEMHWQVLTALARDRELHWWLPHLSPALWQTVDGPPHHALLASCGRGLRELRANLPEEHHDHYHPDRLARPPSLLTTLQAYLRDDDWPPKTPLSQPDDSIRIHSCHGPVRQIEVLREILTGLLAADATLEPRDLVVLCPDLDTYAPLIRAAFGRDVPADPAEPHDAADEHPGRGLRVRLADRGETAGNPLFAVILRLLEMAEGRVSAAEILELAATAPVRRCCGFTDEDLERIAEWVTEAGARWGIGRRQRETFGLGDFAQNTINGAVDRLLLGVTAAETGDQWLDLALPLTDVDSGDIDLAGRFAEFVDRVAVMLRELRGPHSGFAWAEVVIRALDLLTDLPAGQAGFGAQARREVRAGIAPAGGTQLGRGDIESLLASRFTEKSGRANYGTGELLVCAPAALRGLPHRVVVLLGVDDTAFTGSVSGDGEDVLRRQRRPGERDARIEERALLLEAIGAAREKLVVLYTGADPITGAPRPPATAMAELVTVLRAHLTPKALAHTIVRHPLQDWDPRNFHAPHPLSFDAAAHAAAAAEQKPPRRFPMRAATVLPPADSGDVELAQLLAFVEHPVRGFLGQRLGIRIPDHEDLTEDRLPIEISGLASWDIGERLVHARLAGADAAHWRAAEWRRGTLPPFALGAAALADIERTAEAVVRAAQDDYRTPPRAVDLAIDLGAGRRLTGTVPQVHGEVLVRTTFSRVAAKHRLTAWVQLVALAAAGIGDWRAAVTGRGRFRRKIHRTVLTAPDPDRAREILRDLVSLREAGLREPLPLPTAAAGAYSDYRFRGFPVDESFHAAAREFQGGSDIPGKFGEHTDRHLRYVWGPTLRFADIVSSDPIRSDPLVGDAETTAAENTRFGALATRLWMPLLAHEEVATR